MHGTASRQPNLTERQREILERIARGRTNPEIAAELGIGFETVKMHVSRILAELGVSSREEAATWWRAAHSPRQQLRRALAWLLTLKVIGPAGAVVALAAAGIAALAITCAGGDSSEPAGVAAQTETATSTPTSSPSAPTASPTETPVDVGWEAAAAALKFELVDFQADALATWATIRIHGSIRETGWPLMYVIDATGQRLRFNGGRTDGTPDGWELAWRIDPISPQPGTVRIEVTPVREYVIPPLGKDDPTPIWASFEVPFDGYTSPLVELPLPQPATKDYGPGSVTISRIAATGSAGRIEYHFSMPPGVRVSGQYGDKDDVCAGHSPLPGLYDQAGSFAGVGGGGGADGEFVITSWRLTGPVTILFTRVECEPFPTPVPGQTAPAVITMDPNQPTPTPRPAGMTDLEAARADSLEYVEFVVEFP